MGWQFVSEPLDISLELCIQGRFQESAKILRSLDPEDPRVKFNLGWHDCREGKLSDGLRKMDAGRYINVFGSPRIPGTIWRDQDLEDKTILLRLEGGLGDQIMGFRFANAWSRTIISCARELFPLFGHMPCVDSSAAHLAHYDYWVPAMSAPHVLGLEYETLSGKPYLSAKPRKLHSSKGLRVGIKWSGNPQFEHQQHRLFPRELMLDLANTPGTTFYSLQRDEDFVDGLPFSDLRASLTTWRDTAEIVAGLDLLITSCTSVAHLGGALGIPTWVVVPILPYYCWSQPGPKSSWYDSVRLFRQVKYGCWEQPFSEIRSALERVASDERRAA